MSSSGPRILLFGTPGAGKTSLLGALVQAAAMQSNPLKGTLVDESGALDELRDRVYELKAVPVEASVGDAIKATRTKQTRMPAKLEATEECTSYEIHLKPSEGGRRTDATLIDCSGNDAQSMMKSKQPFLDSHPIKHLALDSDTVLLAIDVSQPGKQLLDQFQQFARWLTQLHETRGRRTDVGALPVYLVLTKCDQLAKPNDTVSMWLQRIEEAKRKIDEKFREFLKTQGTGFGSLQVRLWATAIKRPGLSDRAAKAQEPFGVAELFRQCLQSATDYVQRRDTSQYRLSNLVIGMIGTIALLFLAMYYLVELQPETKHSALQDKVRAVLPKKENDLLKLSINTLKKKRDQLSVFRQDCDFEELPDTMRDKVNRIHKELDDYLQRYDAAQSQLKDPHLTQNEEEYAKFRESANAFKLSEGEEEYIKFRESVKALKLSKEEEALKLKLTKEQEERWKITRLTQRVAQVRKEYEIVDDALQKEKSWVDSQAKKNTSLLRESNEIYGKLLDQLPVGHHELETWESAYRKQEQVRSPNPPESYIAGTRMKYEDLEKFGEFKRSQTAWKASKSELMVMSKNIRMRMKF
jgi:GTPase SAR1 family protein